MTKKTSVASSTAYPVLPLRDIVVFPHMIVPLFVGREKSIRALEEVMGSDKQIMLVTQINASDDDPDPSAIHNVGTVANVLQLLKLPDGTVKVLVEGRARAEIDAYTSREDFYEALGHVLEEPHDDPVELEALSRSVVSEFESYVKLNKKISPEVVGAASQIDDYSKLADTVASHLSIKITEKQEMLETTSVKARLEKALGFMEGEISVLQVEKRIRSRVKRQMEKTQREYYLNEQMKAIQKELGDGEEGRDEMAELEERISKTKLSKEAREKADAELKKLRQMSPMSAEATVVRNYLDWLLGIPWGKKSKIKSDLNHAEEILEADHFGLDKVKERIVEYLAVQARAAKLKGPILCLVGPPGVGKTSLAQSIAKATGREYRPHGARRRSRRSRNPRPPPHLYRLDARQGHPVDEEGEEVQSALPARRDRQDGHGFPRRSVLGPARSARPGAELDLHAITTWKSITTCRDVMFITTANTLNIPAPLMDRMEIIRIAGYTEDEKLRNRQAAPAAEGHQGTCVAAGGIFGQRRCPDGDQPAIHPRSRRA